MLLCGDFNAMPGEPAIRLLSGLTEGADVLDGGAGHGRHAGHGRPYPTAAGHVGGGGRNRRSQGLEPSLVPGRRIDYMFSYGWNHGRPGGWTGNVSVEDAGRPTTRC